MPSRLDPLAFAAALLLTLAPLLTSSCDKGEGDKPKENSAAGNTDGKSGAPGPVEAGDVPAAMLVIGPATITPTEQPGKGVEIAADGSLTIDGAPVGKLGTDGRLIGVDGQLVMEVDADGKVRSPDGKPAPFTLTDTGMVMQVAGGEGVTVVFAEDGSVRFETPGPKPDAPQPPVFVSEGCTGDVTRACALALTTYVAYMLAGAVGDPQAEAEAAPAVSE